MQRPLYRNCLVDKIDGICRWHGWEEMPVQTNRHGIRIENTSGRHALVEYPDGRLVVVKATLIQFLDRPQSPKVAKAVESINEDDPNEEEVLDFTEQVANAENE